MAMHTCVPALLFLTLLQIILSSTVASPEASLGLWVKFRNLPKHYRLRRAEKKSLELEKRLNKCWLVDIRKSR